MTFYPYPTDAELPRAGDRTGRNDRLVRRFVAEMRLRVHLRLGAHPSLHSRPTSADVVNVSIAGASVRVTGTMRVHAGALVTIGDGDSTASCRVVYTIQDRDGTQILGLEFTEQTEQFRLDVGRVIGALRKDRGQIIKAWHRPN